MKFKELSFNKYFSKRSKSSDGKYFHSKAEAICYETLLLMKKKGVIVELKTQPQVYLTKAKIIYKPDFYVRENNNNEYYVECKGFETDVWRLKRRLYEYYGKIPLQVWKVQGGRTVLYEVIEPKKYD